MFPWLIIVIGLLVVILGIVFAMRLRKGKIPPTDYFGWFWIGMVWTVAGIVAVIFGGRDQSFFIVMGMAFAIAGWVHRKEWKANRKQWKDKKRIIIAVIALGILMAVFIVMAMMRG